MIIRLWCVMHFFPQRACTTTGRHMRDCRHSVSRQQWLTEPDSQSPQRGEPQRQIPLSGNPHNDHAQCTACFPWLRKALRKGTVLAPLQVLRFFHQIKSVKENCRLGLPCVNPTKSRKCWVSFLKCQTPLSGNPPGAYAPQPTKFKVFGSN
jgi:hypothetical protein